MQLTQLIHLTKKQMLDRVFWYKLGSKISSGAPSMQLTKLVHLAKEQILDRVFWYKSLDRTDSYAATKKHADKAAGTSTVISASIRVIGKPGWKRYTLARRRKFILVLI